MLEHWLWLTTRKGLGARSVDLVLRHFGSPKAVYEAADYRAVEGLRDAEGLLDKDLSLPKEILRQCRERDISILTMEDAAYPKRLAALDDAPAVLYYKGTLPDLNDPAIAVVGTRKASVYGLSQSRRMAFGLSRCGFAVVTGGAAGIDTEAIKGALTADGVAIVVLGCGVDVNYPHANRFLFRDVCRKGCMISEYPPGTKPFSGHFPIRNRIISGMSLGVLVVEAPEKSGARITANRALDQGRDVFTLPANLDVESCAGNLQLLREGAIAVGSAWDILQEYEAIYPKQLSRRPLEEPETQPESVQEQVPETPKEPILTKKVIDKPKSKSYIDLKDIMASLSQDEQCLVSLLQKGPMHIDILAERSQLGTRRALASLTLLEVKRLVCRPSAGMYELAEQ